MNDAMSSAVEAAISQATGNNFAIQSAKPCGGSCINHATTVTGDGRSYFIKYNAAEESSQMYAAEIQCLRAINDAASIRAPRPIAQGSAGGSAFLILEAIAFGPAPHDWSVMGKELAALHHKVSDRFGWAEDNFIGASPQYNDWSDNWATFYRDQRLRPQLEMAEKRGAPVKGGEALLDKVSALLAEHTPYPSLLHGDLWGGNAGHDLEGKPVIFDPASYYGDRETDLAFTEFFGGFPRSFYTAYHSAWPLPHGHELRKTLYNLYHVLNHANLFGGGYHAQAEGMISQLLRSI